MINYIAGIGYSYQLPLLICAKIEQEVAQTLERAQIVDAPVNPIAVVNDLGYTVHAALFEERAIGGKACVRYNLRNQVSLYVSAYLSPRRRRFAIAHELGHAILHLSGLEHASIWDLAADLDHAGGTVSFFKQIMAWMNRKSYRTTKAQAEVEADYFARALLMPKGWMLARLAEGWDLRALAHLCGVSLYSMHLRVRELRA